MASDGVAELRVMSEMASRCQICGEGDEGNGIEMGKCAEGQGCTGISMPF